MAGTGDPSVLFLKVHSLYHEDPDKYVSPVDAYRTHRPSLELKKHGWDTEIRGKWFDAEKVDDPKMLSELRKAGERFKVIYLSYLREPVHYTLLKWLEDNYGTKIVMDIDDDLFDIADWNPAKEHLYPGSKDHFALWSVLRDVAYLTTTTEHLAEKYRKLREGKPVTVLPNFASEEFYCREPAQNGGRVVIGWQGSAHHHGDLYYSGFYDALLDVMHMHKNVYFHSVGHPVTKYLPGKRYRESFSERGAEKWQEMWRQLDFDINCAPLEDSEFNKGKSNIKWQEGTLMGVPTVASNVGPYKDTIKHGSTGYLCADKTQWVMALSLLVSDAKKRKEVAANARKELDDNWVLEKKWPVYADYFRSLA